MPIYLFVVERDGRETDDIRWSNLADDRRAQGYARLLIRELNERPRYRGLNVKMIVKDGDGLVIHVIPF